MSAGAPWSVKGIDPKAREVAKDLARRSGMTLGEWLNRVILEDDVPDEITAEAQFGARPRPGPVAGETARIAYSLERLTARLEAAETRTGLAVSGVEREVRNLVARLDAAERAQLAVAAQVHKTQERQAGLTERLRLLETAGPRSPEALRLLEAHAGALDADALTEAVLDRLGDRLARAERQTAEQLGDLADSLALLEDRLARAERGGSSANVEQRFQTLSDSLTRQIEAVRAEVAGKLQASVGGDVEVRLAEMAGHVAAAERRARAAVERMGREVLTMAEAVNRRLVTTEERSAEAIDLVGAEIARVAGAVELRLARAEQAQAEGLERLTGEVRGVTDRLSERMAVAEQRAADAIQAVGEQVARLGERLQLSPEPQASAPQPDAEAAAEPPQAAFGPELFERAETLLLDEAAAIAPRFAPEALQAEAFAPIPEPEEDIFAAEVLDPPAGVEAEARPLSTREVIEQARAAARAARPVEVRAKVGGKAASGRLFEGFGQAKPRRPSTALHTALMIAGGAAFLSVGAAGVVLMEQPGSSAQEAALAPLAPEPRAAIALAPESSQAKRDAPAGAEAALAEAWSLTTARKPGGLSKLKALADEGYAPAQLRLGELYEAGGAGVARNLAEARRWTALAAEAGLPQAMHNLGVYYFRGDGGPQDLASAAQWFRKAAEAGVVESQFNLGLLYQSGSGVRRDTAEALKWFKAAAAQGDAQARQAVEALAPKA